MKQYSIPFEYAGRSFTADVTEIDGLDHVQYAISPRDESLGVTFKTNIIRKDKDDNEWHYDIPEGADGDVYMASLLTGLKKYLLATT